MADFLYRLAERALRLTPTVEPWIPPAYNAGWVSPGLPPRDSIEEQSEATILAPPGAADAPSDRGSLMPREVRPFDVADTSASLDPKPDAATAKRAATPSPGTPAEAVRREPVSTRFTNARVVHAWPPDPARSERTAGPVPPSAPPTPVTVVPPEFALAHPPAIEPKIPPLVIPSADRPARPRASESRGVQREAQAPIVRVTIGRVDVRAVTTPAPRPERAPVPTPRLTLTEYLERRERGGR